MRRITIAPATAGKRKTPQQHLLAASLLAKGESIERALTRAGWSPTQARRGRLKLSGAIQQALLLKGLVVSELLSRPGRPRLKTLA